MPLVVRKSGEKVKANFLRGLADTDFSLCFKKNGKSPTIGHCTYSQSLHESVKELLTELGFTYYAATYFRERNGSKLVTHHIEINGKKKLEQWIKLIGFSSFNTITRYQVWKETGSLPVGTNINERIEILKERGE